MSTGVDPNYMITALIYGLIVVAIVVVVAIVFNSRHGGEARVEYEHSDRTGSIRMRGVIKAPNSSEKSGDRLPGAER